MADGGHSSGSFETRGVEGRIGEDDGVVIGRGWARFSKLVDKLMEFETVKQWVCERVEVRGENSWYFLA